MAKQTFTQLKTYLDANINTNGIQSITGAIENNYGTNLLDSIAHVDRAGLKVFSDLTEYKDGDSVLYNGVPYIFTADHTGSWTGTDVVLLLWNGSRFGFAAYNNSTAYSIGNKVLYKLRVYDCILGVTGVAPDDGTGPLYWSEINSTTGEFGKAYANGVYNLDDVVIYNDLLYQQTDSDDFISTDIATEIGLNQWKTIASGTNLANSDLTITTANRNLKTSGDTTSQSFSIQDNSGVDSFKVFGSKNIVQYLPSSAIADVNLFNDAVSFYTDGTYLKARYKDGVGVASELSIGDPDTNFATTNLTLTGARTHDLANNILTLKPWGSTLANAEIRFGITGNNSYIKNYDAFGSITSAMDWDATTGASISGLYANSAVIVGSQCRLEQTGTTNSRLLIQRSGFGYVQLGDNFDNYINNNLLVGDNGTPSARLHVEGVDTLSTSKAFLVTDGDTVPTDIFDIRNNGRIGIGKNGTAPTSRLDIIGEGNTSSTTAFSVRNSDGNYGINSRDDGFVTLGTSAPMASNVPVTIKYSQTTSAILGIENTNIGSGQATGIRLQQNSKTAFLSFTDNSTINSTNGMLWLQSAVAGNGASIIMSNTTVVNNKFRLFSGGAGNSKEILAINKDASENVTFEFSFEDSAGNKNTSAYIKVLADDTTNTSEDSSMEFHTQNAGTVTKQMTIKNTGVINMANLPTSSAGLVAGDLWNNSGVINIV